MRRRWLVMGEQLSGWDLFGELAAQALRELAEREREVAA